MGIIIKHKKSEDEKMKIKIKILKNKYGIEIQKGS